MSTQNFQRSTRTIYGCELQSALYGKIPYVVRQHTTFNEKFGILAETSPLDTPGLNYLLLGNGGHSYVMGNNFIPLVREKPHAVDHVGLYSHLPFALRALDNDLTPLERNRYALRKIINVGGTPYIAYYARRMDKSTAITRTQIKTIVGQTSTYATFTPSAGNLSPTPPDLSEVGVNPLAGQYAETTTSIPLIFTAQEIEEILNAARLLFGSEEYGVISEVCMASGEDKQIILADQSPFVEAVAVQPCTFINTYHPLIYTRTGLDTRLELGASEPLLTIPV